MANMPWFRLYSEIINDHKIARIARELQQSRATVIGTWVILMALSSEAGDRGKLLISDGIPYTLDDLDCVIDLGDRELLVSLLDRFVALGMLTDNDGTYEITNWGDRQFPSDDRGAYMREYRKKSVTECKTDVKDCDANVKRRNNLESDSESELNKEKDELNNSPTSQFLRVFPGLTFETGDQVARFNKLVDVHKIDKVLEVAAWLKQRDPPKSMGHALSAIQTAIVSWKAKKNGKVVVSREKFRADVKKYGLET